WETGTNGLDWRAVPLPEGAGRPLALAVGGTPVQFVLATRPPGLYRKAPGAAGWTALAAPPAPAGVVAPWVRVLTPGSGISPTWFAAVAGAGLWRSEDGGASWTACPGLPAEVHAIRAAAGPPGTVVLATSDGCWISRDDGRTWEDRGAGLGPARHLSVVEVAPDDPNFLLAGAAPTTAGGAATGGGVRGGLRFALYESKDGGKTWTHVTRGFPVELESDPIVDIRFDPAAPEFAVVALASGECWNTRTAGAWWEPLARQLRGVRALCAV
ncbi:MAG TPA: hypothetical protein VF590_27355, partial [Isosphaeraceae bacterium]